MGVLTWVHTNNLFSQAVSEKEQGLVMGVSQSLWSIGGMLGTAFVGFVAAVKYQGVAYLPVLFILFSWIAVKLMIKSFKV